MIKHKCVYIYIYIYIYIIITEWIYAISDNETESDLVNIPTYSLPKLSLKVSGATKSHSYKYRL